MSARISNIAMAGTKRIAIKIPVTKSPMVPKSVAQSQIVGLKVPQVDGKCVRRRLITTMV